MVRDYTRLLFFLHPSFAGLATCLETFFNPHRMLAHGTVCETRFGAKRMSVFLPNKKPLTNKARRY
jgi:hypothetical protein